MMMDAVTIGTLPTTKPLLSNKIYESTDIPKEKIDDISFADDLEDDEMRLRLSDEEEIEQDNISSKIQNLQPNSPLKKDGFELDVPTTVNCDDKSDVCQEDLKKTEVSAEQDDKSASDKSVPVNSEESSEVCQQDSKDTDVSGEQEKTPTSVDVEEKSEVCQEESKACQEESKVCQEESKVCQEKSEANQQEVETCSQESESVQQESEACKQESKDLDKNVDQIDTPESESVNPKEKEESSEVVEKELEDSNASEGENNYSSDGDLDEEGVTENGTLSDEDSKDKMSHNPTKYWPTFGPRPWKGSRKRPGFPHRGSNSWYHQQFPDRDKLKKNNLHHSNSHFIRSSRSRGSFSSSARDSWARDVNRRSSRELNSSKQNGIANGLDHKENNSSSQNDKVITVTNKADKVGVKNKDLISASQSKRSLSSDKMNGNDCGGVQLINGVVKYVDKERSSSTASATITKNCDLSITEYDKRKSSSQNTESDSSKTSKIGEVLSEAQIQIKDVTSQNNGTDNKSKDSMDVDESVNDKPDSTSDLICIQTNIRDVSEKNDKNDDSDDISIIKDKTNGSGDHNLERSKSMTFAETASNASGVKNYQSMDVDANTESPQIVNNDDDWRDSESGSLVIDESALAKENQKSNDKVNAETDKTLKDADKSGAANNVIEEVDLIDDDSQEATLKSSNVDTNASLSVPIDNSNGDKIEESNQDGRAAVHKRRRRKKLIEAMQEESLANEPENGVRQKRRSARNAEEMIRKEILKGDNEEDDSSDDVDNIVKVNYRKSSTPNIITRTLSPPTLKRTLDDLSDEKDNNAAANALKRIRAEDSSVTVAQETRKEPSSWKSKESVAATGQLMRKMAQDDIRGKLKKLTQEELEALLLQKVVECITVRGEMGKLREQARASKKVQESLRNKCQQLHKQVEGFEMVLKRITYDKTNNSDKYIPPIKINRSVGLQVNFLSPERGVQSLKQIQSNNRGGSNGTNTPNQMSTQVMPPDHQSPRKMMKTRSPRRTDAPATTMVQVPIPSSISAQANNVNSPALVMTPKSVDPSAKRSTNILQLVPSSGNQQQIVNGRPALTVQRTVNKSSDLIDLTDEEDKAKVASIAGGLPARMPRVLQAVPASGVTLANAGNLRLVPAVNSHAAMGNNVTRLAYVMQNGPNGVPTKQLVLTTNNSVKTVTSLTTTGINYKRSVTTLPNGTVRLVPTTAPTMHLTKHPAPLPESPIPPSDPSWKLAPPAPSLKISKVATGIVLSWNMTLSEKYADIVSYQLYAYQEVAGTPPSASLWKKVGDVRALPLPMACTLTQFTEGNNYYFAVRAVDAHSRFGQYSKPGNISL